MAFANRRDAHHRWAIELASRVTEPLLTCEAVLAEACFHLESAALVSAFVTEGLVRPAFDAASHLPRLAELAACYSDRKPDLADLCLIRMSELHPTPQDQVVAHALLRAASRLSRNPDGNHWKQRNRAGGVFAARDVPGRDRPLLISTPGHYVKLRASRGVLVSTRHAGVRTPHAPATKCEVILARSLSSFSSVSS